jgi:hypothetical protein
MTFPNARTVLLHSGLLLIGLASVLYSQTDLQIGRLEGTVLPDFRRTHTFMSPDKRWILIAPPPSKPDQKRMLLVRRSGQKSDILIRRYERSIRVEWAPDSSAFFLNDESGSNVTDASIYWPGHTNSLELGDAILVQDTEAKAIPADHAYLQARRWIDSSTVLVEYCGHNSGVPAQRFDFLYRIAIGGPDHPFATVRRISRTLEPSSTSFPDCLP